MDRLGMGHVRLRSGGSRHGRCVSGEDHSKHEPRLHCPEHVTHTPSIILWRGPATNPVDVPSPRPRGGRPKIWPDSTGSFEGEGVGHVWGANSCGGPQEGGPKLGRGGRQVMWPESASHSSALGAEFYAAEPKLGIRWCRRHRVSSNSEARFGAIPPPPPGFVLGFPRPPGRPALDLPQRDAPNEGAEIRGPKQVDQDLNGTDEFGSSTHPMRPAASNTRSAELSRRRRRLGTVPHEAWPVSTTTSGASSSQTRGPMRKRSSERAGPRRGRE